MRNSRCRGWFYSSEYLTPILCRNLRSSGVPSVSVAADFGVPANAPVKQSRQQSERGFTTQTFLWHREQCQWITRSWVDERPSADICFGTLPHLQDSGNVRYSIFGTPASVHQLRNRRYKAVGGEVAVRFNSLSRSPPEQDQHLLAKNG
jgi:hypothetical protein